MLNTASKDSPKMAVQEQDAAIPVIQVTEPVSEKFKEKTDTEGTENVLQMIIDQQKARRKKFIFREGGQLSGSVDDKAMDRGESTDSEHSSASSTGGPPSAGDGNRTTGDQN